MDYLEIERKFLDYFKSKDHKLFEEVSLVPKETDPSALFTIAGMSPLKNYFLGIEKPVYNKLCSSQRCFRTIDIDDVGDNNRTLTFFFMLGSWSIGDYWKEKAIELAYDLLVNKFKLDKNKLYVSVFKGNKEIPKDKETINAWKKVGIKKIVELSEEHNIWSAGSKGPCGTCTEVYYDQGKKFGCGKKNCKPGCDCDRFLEIWNAGVFMEFYRGDNNKLKELPIKSVDTGCGLERISAILEKKDSVFETDMFLPILKELEKLSNKKYGSSEEVTKAMRVILDHIRASVFLIYDGVKPSKIDQGYVLRRILRRMIRYGNKLNLKEKDFLDLAKSVIKEYSKKYDLNKKEHLILEVIKEEYDKFVKTLEKGTNLLNRLFENKKKIISGIDAFHLYDTFGFPIELTQELALEKGFKVDINNYLKEFEKHKEKSRSSAEKKFKSGLIDTSYETIKLHTATHLLHQALREVLSKDIKQRGSNITPERLRFDFNFDRKLTDTELKRIEDKVNEKIKHGLEVKKEEMSVEEALKKGVIGIFHEKYKEKVNVYSIGDYSKEICAGPHVKNTKELGKFKILKEESVAAGIRRIKAKLN